MNVRILYFWVTLSFSFCTLLSCQTEELYVKEKNLGEKSGVKTEYLKGLEARKAANLLRTKFNGFGGTGQNHNLMREELTEIDYSNILMVMDTLGIKNYVFKIVNHPDDDLKTFHNLVLTDKEGEFALSIMKYHMTDLFAEQYYDMLKKIGEFEGTITSKGLQETDPCEDIVSNYPTPINDDPTDYTGGGGGYEGSYDGPTFTGGGSDDNSDCIDVSFSILCECGRSYSSWEAYLASICGDGSNPGYDATLVITYDDNCGTNANRCNPDGVIGVIKPENDCNTSKDKLKLVFPNTPDDVLEEIATNINLYGKDFGIDTKEKLQHFLSQAGHESTSLSGTEFGAFTENLNYRISKLGSEVFKRYFNPIETPTADPNKANPNDYVSATNSLFVDHEMFANYVYNDANRSEKGKLGNVNIGDGFKFIGRGIIQLTGRTNYTAFNTFYQENYDNSVDLLENPELVVSDKKIAVISALWFFKNNVLDKLSPTLDSNTTCLSVSKLVNGGTNGLTHRTTLLTSSQTNIDCL